MAGQPYPLRRHILLPSLVSFSASGCSGFGAAKMALSALGTGLVTLYAYDQGWRTALVVGLALAMSSTAIVAKMLLGTLRAEFALRTADDGRAAVPGCRRGALNFGCAAETTSAV
jgi:predicted Kef-type K+ transport protein